MKLETKDAAAWTFLSFIFSLTTHIENKFHEVGSGNIMFLGYQIRNVTSHGRPYPEMRNVSLN